MSPDPDPQAIAGRVTLYCDRLAEALDALETAGGLPGLSRTLSPKAVARVAERLRLIQAETAEALTGYRPPRSPQRPRPRPVRPSDPNPSETNREET